MRWILHIGIQKTGSKAIQAFLANDAETIRNARLYFPIQGREGIWHEPLYWALCEGNGRDLEEAVAVSSSGQWDIGVFSCEAFHELPPTSVRLLRDTLGRSQIVLFIRRQDDALNSLLNQYAKAHRVSIGEVADFERRLTEYNPNFDYRAIISKWADVFGKDGITPIVYDKRTDAVRLFCEAVGVAVPEGYTMSRNPNPALSQRAYDAFRSAKTEVSSSAELPLLVEGLHREFASEMLNTFRESGPRLFDGQVARQILRLYAPSNEWVRANWFPSRATLFEPSD